MADIVDTAVAAGKFKTLVAAVKAAGLVDTLKGPGPFTVFAPTDAAFAKLPAGTLEALLADKAKLTAILTYHVVPGKVMAADVMKLDGKTAKTVQGGGSRSGHDAGRRDGRTTPTVTKTDIACQQRRDPRHRHRAHPGLTRPTVLPGRPPAWAAGRAPGIGPTLSVTASSPWKNSKATAKPSALPPDGYPEGADRGGREGGARLLEAAQPQRRRAGQEEVTPTVIRPPLQRAAAGRAVQGLLASVSFFSSGAFAGSFSVGSPFR